MQKSAISTRKINYVFFFTNVGAFLFFERIFLFDFRPEKTHKFHLKKVML